MLITNRVRICAKFIFASLDNLSCLEKLQFTIFKCLTLDKRSRHDVFFTKRLAGFRYEEGVNKIKSTNLGNNAGGLIATGETHKLRLDLQNKGKVIAAIRV